MRRFSQRFCEKFLKKVPNFIDVFNLRNKGYSSWCCMSYYAILFIVVMVFLVFLGNSLTIMTNREINEKDNILEEAIERFLTRKESLNNFALELKFRNYSIVSTTNKQLVYHYPLRYFNMEANDNPKTLKNHEIIQSHTFPSSFFLMDISAKTQGLFLEPLALSHDMIWTKDNLTNTLRSFCVEILYQRSEFQENNNTKKSHSVKKQRLCDINNNNTKGIRVHLMKFEEIKLYNLDCDSKSHCHQICLESNLFYIEDTYLQDKLLTLVTCQRPFIAEEICFIVRYDHFSDSLIYEGGCFNGIIEKFRPLEKLDVYIEFNKTRLFVREPLDPYISALNQENEVYELPISMHFESIKKALISLLMVILIGFFGLLADKMKKWTFGRKEIELEGFNQHEMSSAK